MPDRPGDMDERDVDARFASIVARWDGPVPDADDTPADDAPGRASTDPAPPTRSPTVTPRPRTPTPRDRRAGCR